MCAKSLQLCLTLCDPMDCRVPPFPCILRSRKIRRTSPTRLHLIIHTAFSGLGWTVAHQAPLSMGFSRQEYWSGLSYPSPGDLPDSWIEPMSVTSPAVAAGFVTTSTTWEALSESRVLLKNYLLFCLCWVFTAAHELSLAVASGDYSLVSVCGLLIVMASLLQSTGSRARGLQQFRHMG